MSVNKKDYNYTRNKMNGSVATVVSKGSNTFPKYNNTQPEFYLEKIEKFGTEENFSNAKNVLTSQFIKLNFYRTRMCANVKNMEEDKIVQSFLKKKNWRINTPNEHSVWNATNISTNNQSKNFRLCSKDCCFDAHNNASLRKAVCFFDLFGIGCNNSNCGFLHNVELEQYLEEIKNLDMPLLENGKLVESKNGEKLFKVFYYFNQIRIWHYASSKTIILKTNDFFQESALYTNDDIFKNIDLLQSIFKSYFNIDLFNNKTKSEEITLFSFLIECFKFKLRNTFDNLLIYSNEFIEEIIEAYISGNFENGHFDLVLNSLLSIDFDNIDTTSNFICTIIKNFNIPFLYNYNYDISNYQQRTKEDIKRGDEHPLLLLEFINFKFTPFLNESDKNDFNYLFQKIIGMFREESNFENFIFRFTKVLKSNEFKYDKNKFDENALFEVIIEAINVILDSQDEFNLHATSKKCINIINTEFKLKSIETINQTEPVKPIEAAEVIVDNNAFSRSLSPNLIDNQASLGNSIPINNEPLINSYILDEMNKEENLSEEINKDNILNHAVNENDKELEQTNNKFIDKSIQDEINYKFIHSVSLELYYNNEAECDSFKKDLNELLVKHKGAQFKTQRRKME
jgi:hypothetical protein